MEQLYNVAMLGVIDRVCEAQRAESALAKKIQDQQAELLAARVRFLREIDALEATAKRQQDDRHAGLIAYWRYARENCAEWIAVQRQLEVDDLTRAQSRTRRRWV